MSTVTIVTTAPAPRPAARPAPRPAAAPAPGVLTLAALLTGPVLTVAALHSAHQGGALPLPLSMYVATALLFWSPLPFSIPAVLLEAHRDQVLPGSRGMTRLLRGLVILPVLLTRPGARAATAASLAGFAVAAAVGAPLLDELPLPFLR